MDKKKLLEVIVQKLEKDLGLLQAAALETHSAATSEHNKPENQYDTRAIEASYLAGAQAKRAFELEGALTAFRFLETKNFEAHQPIAVTALMELRLNGRKLNVFLVSQEGGFSVECEGKNIQVITLASPLGEALLGAKVGDTADVDRGNDTLEYEILSVN